jgi:RNA polymerase sigma factor for flagellar operon FliA
MTSNTTPPKNPRHGPDTEADFETTPRNELVERYAPLARTVALKIAYRLPPSVELDDLISAGVIGLLDAVEKYDRSKNTSFRRYAEIRIRGAILDELRSLDWVSRTVRRDSSQLNELTRRKTQELGREPSEEEMAQEMGVDLQSYHELLNKLKPILVVGFEDLGLNRDGDRRNVDDFIKDPRNVDPHTLAWFGKLRSLLQEIVQTLPEKQRIVVSLYYFEQMNLKSIGAKLGVTESRVSQIHSEACKTLRTRLRRELG